MIQRDHAILLVLAEELKGAGLTARTHTDAQVALVGCFLVNNSLTYWFCGAPGMTRTCDLLVRSQTLYPTELRAQGSRSFINLAGCVYFRNCSRQNYQRN